MARIATVGDGDMDVYNNLGTSYPGGNAVNVGVHLFRLGSSRSLPQRASTPATSRCFTARLP